ncbi:S-layer homology domain-containing protein, partial [Paenibacillus sp. MCAF20]
SSTTVGEDTNLFLTFHEPVRLGTGNIHIRRLADQSIAQTFAIADGEIQGADIEFSGNNVMLDPNVDLSGATAYYVEVSSGSFEDYSGLPFSGLVGAEWHFNTYDLVPPQLVSISPDDNRKAPLSGSLILTLDEDVMLGDGDIRLYKQGVASPVLDIYLSGGSVFADGKAQVELSGSRVILTPYLALEKNTSYYVQITSGAIVDLSGNAFSGFMDTTTWDFTTISSAPSKPPEDNQTLPSDNSGGNTDEDITPPTLDNANVKIIVQAFKPLEGSSVNIPVSGTLSNHTLVYYYDSVYKAWIAVPTSVNGNLLGAEVPPGTWISVLENKNVYQPSDSNASWANIDILKMMSLNVLQGFTDNTFKPNVSTTRYQMAVVIAKALNLSITDIHLSTSENNEWLKSIPAWAQPYVAAVLQYGIMVGNGGDFDGEGALTRAQLATMIGKLIKDADASADKHLSNFTDASLIPSWATEGVQRALDNGILQGYPDGSFKPEGTVTRAEMAAIILRLMDYLQSEKTKEA